MSKSFFELRENWASKAQYKNMRGGVKGANKYSGMDKARLKKILSVAQDELDDLQGSRMKAAGGRGLPKGSKQDIADLKDKIANVKAALKESVELDEALKKDSDDPCWKDYVQLGTKKKNGKEVPNCVPKEEAELDEAKLYVVMNKKTGKAVTKPMSMGMAMDAYDSRGGNAKGFAVVATDDKRLKESVQLGEKSPIEDLKTFLGKRFNKNYPKALEWMKKNNKTAADAARMFSGVDARELAKMADA